VVTSESFVKIVEKVRAGKSYEQIVRRFVLILATS
jgi:hypothetical protein